MKLTLLDRLLLGKTFTFRSDLSPAECIELIDELLPLHSTRDAIWRDTSEQSLIDSESWCFTLWVEYPSRGTSVTFIRSRVSGMIERSDALGSSLITGVVRCSPLIWFFVLGAGFLLVLITPVLTMTNYPKDGEIVLSAVVVVVLAVLFVWAFLQDRQRMLTHLEQSLQASYRAQKKAEYPCMKLQCLWSHVHG